MRLFLVGLWRLFITFLVVIISAVQTTRVTLGLLCPWDSAGSHDFPLSGSRNAGAVPLAIEYVYKERILANNSIDFVYRDSRCDSRRASGSAVDLYLLNHVHAFIGPACSEPCRSVKDLTAYWNVPSVSWFCPEAPATTADDVYESFARTYAPFSSIADLPLAVMDHYAWTSSSVIYADTSVWESLAQTILSKMINRGLTVSNLQSYNQPLSVPKAVSMLQQVKHVSHVIWLIVGGVTTLEADEQMFMLAAESLSMTGGEQVFIRLELFPDPGYTTPWSPLLVNQSLTIDQYEPNENTLRRAYETLLILTYRLPADGRIDEFLGRVSEGLHDPAFDNYFETNSSKPGIMSAFLYDAVLLFAYSARQHVLLNGYVQFNYTRTNTSFDGMTGYVVLDSAGDRIANFSLLDLKNGETFQAVGHVSGTEPKFEPISGQDISWPGSVVPREPKCGYRGENCLDSSIVVAAVAGGLVTLVLIILIPYLSLKYRKYILRKDWLVELNELTFLPMSNSTIGIGLQGYPSSYRLPNLSGRLLSQQSIQETLRKQSQNKAPNFSIAKFKSGTVVLRKARIGNSLVLNQVTKKELKEMKWLVHDNLNRFIGVCFPVRGDSSIFYHVSEYCSKGSLKTVLANDDIKLDLSFKLSFINDLGRGMQFLHSTVVKSHGLLCSNLCFIDSRWALKIAGFGAVSFHMSRETVQKISNPDERFAKMFWTSPELLRQELPTKGSPKGDVYSFGILIDEILNRTIPYQETGMSSSEIIRRVIRRDEPPLRPRMITDKDNPVDPAQSDGVISRLTELMTHCWQEHPEDRPDFSVIRQRLRALQKGRKELNLMDNMVSKMERYTENLEQVVADRTSQLLEEKKKTDALLYRMLPQAVADKLKKGQSFHGESYDEVTLYFSDIVGFTHLSAMSTPMQVVDLLNDLYTCFDAILETFDVYKVETIGDAYMVASGLPRRNGNMHASEVASMALAVREAVKTFRVRHLPEHHVQIRIGINSGPVAAGVVGLMMPRFCLFGDTVNTASRMESNGLPQQIHVSWSTATLLTSIGGYRLEVRGQVKIKGKGVMTTFWLLGRDGQPRALQAQEDFQTNSVKKISTDTVISEDSLLSPGKSDSKDLCQDSPIIASGLPMDYIDEKTSEETTNNISSGPCNSNRNYTGYNITNNAAVNATTNENPTGTTSLVTDTMSRTKDLSNVIVKEDSKTVDLVTKPNEITSSSADHSLQDGEFVRTQSGDIIELPGGEIIKMPIKRFPPHLTSLREDAINLPNVPSLPTSQNSDKRNKSDIFSYTVPLPELLTEISSNVESAVDVEEDK